MGRNIAGPKFKDTKKIDIDLDSFAKGLNTLVASTKIRDDELAVANNIILKGSGAPVRRWGTLFRGNAINTSSTPGDGSFAYYNSDGSAEHLVLTEGFLKRENPSTGDYNLITGASFASGVRASAVMAFDSLYITNGIDPLVKYDGSILVPFTAILAPGSNWASLAPSLASGPNVYSYRVSAVNAIGETLAATAATVATDINRDNWQTSTVNIDINYGISINWTSVSGATGYNIYGVKSGDETYLGHVDGETNTEWTDYGVSTPSQFFTLPVGNSTGGQRGDYITEFKSSLLMTDSDNPSRVVYSAGVDKIESFLISDGAGWIDISKNSDDGKIKGLAKYQNKGIVLKERSVWSLDFTTSAIPSLSNIVNGLGCISHWSIVNVENDLYFLGRKIGGGPAIYVLGNEPNYLNILRTNELSSRVRPELQELVPDNYEKANAVYFDGKYMLFYTSGGSGANNAAIVYDRERLGFYTWSEIRAGMATVYYDEDNAEHLLWNDTSYPYVTEMSESYTNDNGTAISWQYRTKTFDLGDPFLYKKFHWINSKFDQVSGTINMKVITDVDQTIYSKRVAIDGGITLNTAFRNLQFRQGRFRQTEDQNSVSPVSTAVKRIPLRREGPSAIARGVALDISGDEGSSKAALLNVAIEAMPSSKNYYPRSEVINS